MPWLEAGTRVEHLDGTPGTVLAVCDRVARIRWDDQTTTTADEDFVRLQENTDA